MNRIVSSLYDNDASAPGLILHTLEYKSSEWVSQGVMYLPPLWSSRDSPENLFRLGCLYILAHTCTPTLRLGLFCGKRGSLLHGRIQK